MQVGGWTNPPVGYIDFCQNFPDECAAHGADGAEALDEKRWRDLQEVNTFVNHIVIPVDRPRLSITATRSGRCRKRYGDCEDYVLLKRKWLVERGWPTGVAPRHRRLRRGGRRPRRPSRAHRRGDFVLDNKTDEIRRWYETAYRFVKRQSVTDPNRWVSVGDPRWTTQNTAAPR